jgi:hypothetical protein
MTVETITWIDPDTTQTTFVDLQGITGRGLPPVAFNDITVPDRPGRTLMSVRDDARQIVLPILLEGSSLTDYRTKLRALAVSLHPSTTPGTLRVATIDGLTRDLTCWYVDGFGLLEEYPNWSTPSLLFRALNPYWYDTAAHTGSWAVAAASAFFPIFPMILSADSVNLTPTVTVAGDVAVWPVWTLTGPFTAVRLTLGDVVLELVYTAAAGEVVTIDTRPGAKTVVSSIAGNVFSSLTEPFMFALQPGANAVGVMLTGGAGGVSQVAYSYLDGWLTV